MKTIYLAHPLGPDGPQRENNRRAAASWGAHFAKRYGVAVVADWIWMAGELPETEEYRTLGLACDVELVSRCDEVWMVGPRISVGMRIEATQARLLGKTVRDLTNLVPESIDEGVMARNVWFG